MGRCNHNFIRYEGLTLENVPHGKGVVTLGLISNCGIDIKSNSERYLIIKNKI